MFPNFLLKKLQTRREENSLRQIKLTGGMTDFCSNDYLGIARMNNLLITSEWKHGSGGSRLLSGNYPLIVETEKLISSFHDAEAGLIFNSGYDANTGLLSAVAGKGDVILYDQLIHASLRDGCRLSLARSFSFAHSDLDDLEKKITNLNEVENIYIITESVFSMDGDMAPLQAISDLCKKYKAYLIVDEAHATGIVGMKGQGLVQHLGLQESCFARVHTFGKGCGVHGAIVLGSQELIDYLVNFSRSFIYTTALPEASVAAIKASYEIFPSMDKERLHLKQLIQHFQGFTFSYTLLKSETPIQVVIIPGNEEVKKVAEALQSEQLDVRAILYPTVPRGAERLRIVLHSYNTIEEINRVAGVLNF